MNEGWATFHYTILNRLHEKGLVNDGFMMEFLQSHTNVVSQRGFDERGYGGINPYALGFAMMSDIRRICEAPTPEDRRWFPDIAGGDWLKTLDFAMRNFKDESFISQYLSPKLIREFRFAISDHQANPKLEVAAIHDDEGYRDIRRLLAAQHNRDNLCARCAGGALQPRHRPLAGAAPPEEPRPSPGDDAEQVMKHLARLWGVRLEETEPDGTVSAYREQGAASGGLNRLAGRGRLCFPDVRLWQSARIADSHFQQCGVPRTIRTGGRVGRRTPGKRVYVKAYRGSNPLCPPSSKSLTLQGFSNLWNAGGSKMGNNTRENTCLCPCRNGCLLHSPAGRR